jgi:hypothetical protein
MMKLLNAKTLEIFPTKDKITPIIRMARCDPDKDALESHLESYVCK